ncbi:MAG: DUF4214 domain-containing protein [Telmatospirillum sp.]|nr:DUF4214 domain-containing protein [Telmatospirillum sp.]
MATTLAAETTFVTNIYQNVLLEPASLVTSSSAQITSWATLIVSGVLTEQQVLTDITTTGTTGAWVTNYVVPLVQLYEGFYHSTPDIAGLQNWVAYFSSTAPLSATGAQPSNYASVLSSIAQVFASNTQFTATYGSAPTAQAFVTALYQNILGRAPDAAGLAGYVAYLTSTAGASPSVASMASLALAFVNSAEAKADATAPIQAWLQGGVNGSYASTIPGITGTPAVTNVALTTGQDTVSPAGNTAIFGTYNGTAATQASTFNAGDSINATGLNNTLNLTDIGTGGSADFSNVAGVTVSGVQTLNVISSEAVTANTASSVNGYSGLTALTVKAVGGASITAASTTAVSVTDSALGASHTDSVLGGGNVSITASGAANASAITVGSATAAPTGTVTIVENASLSTAAGAATLGAITVTGGTTVSITENLANSDVTAGNLLTAGAVSVTGTATTTNVVVAQTAAATATAGVTETAAITVGAGGLTAGQSVTIGGLTYTSTGVTTQAQLETAFANLAAGATTGGGAGTGSYTGTLTGFSTGAAAAHVITATSATKFTNVTDLAYTDANGALTSVVETQGSAGTGGIANGAVTITDVNAGSTTKAGTIASVSLTNYASGSSISSNALSTLTIAGTGAGTLSLTDSLTTPTITALTLNLNAATVNAISDVNAELKTLNVVTGGTAASTVGTFTDANLTTLNVSGSQALTFTNEPASLTAINVSGAAGLTISLDPTATTFTSTSTGSDVITITKAATKTITGNGTAGEELVWNADAAPAATAYLGTVTGFKVFGLGGSVATTGNDIFDMSKITGFTALDVQANAHTNTIQFTNVTAATPLSIDGAFAGTLVYQTADTAGATDSLALTLGAAANKAGFTVAALTVEDSQLNGIGNLTITSNASNTSANNIITTLQDASLTNLTLAGTGGLTISNGLTTNAASLSINAISSGKGGLVFSTGITDTHLTSLTLTGTDAINLGTITDGTSGITVNGSAANAGVTLTLAGATSSGHTDSITLGNGTNVVTDSAALAGSTVNITVGTGANTITLGAAATNNVTFGAHSTTATIDTVNVAASTSTSVVPTAILTGLNANGVDTIHFLGDGGNGATGAIVAFTTAQINTYGNNPTDLAGAIAGVLSATGGNLAQHAIAEFQFQGNTYFVEHAGAGHTFAAGDTVVELTGLNTFTTATSATAGVLHLLG